MPRRRASRFHGCAGARFLTEDNDINQQIAIELLGGTGAKVTVANNGARPWMIWS